MARPAAGIARVFGGKPVAVIGASPGGFGTQLGQNAWLPVLRTLGTAPWLEGRLMVSRRSEEHTSELQSLMRISYAVFCLKKKTNIHTHSRSCTREQTALEHTRHRPQTPS